MSTRTKTPTKAPEEQECSFRPEINPISMELASRVDKDKGHQPAWEWLYKLNKERQILLEKKRQEAQCK